MVDAIRYGVEEWKKRCGSIVRAHTGLHSPAEGKRSAFPEDMYLIIYLISRVESTSHDRKHQKFKNIVMFTEPSTERRVSRVTSSLRAAGVSALK